MYTQILLTMVLAACASSAWAADPPALMLFARGVQIYACTQTGETYTWKLKAPEATLMDGNGRSAGRHFAGPSWQAEDGSMVVGDALVVSPAPGGGAIPWIVLRAKENKGDGVFARVAYIVRTATAGGVAPTTGCDAERVGAETRISYSANYTFFPG